MRLSLTINGEPREDDVDPRTLLVHYIRDVAGLTGTHVGCETSLCGACTIHLNGQAVKSLHNSRGPGRGRAAHHH